MISSGRLTGAFAVLTTCVFSGAAYADQPGIICASQSDAAQFVHILDEAPRPIQINYVFGVTRSKGIRCTIVYRKLEIKDAVAEVQISTSDYFIVRVLINNREYFTFQKQKGTRV